MGQAKKRGTFEQRRTEAFIRKAEQQEQERIELAKRKERQRLHDLANPKQAAARHARSRHTSMMLATVLGVSTVGLSLAAPATTKG